MSLPMPPSLSTNFIRAVRSCKPHTNRSICAPPSSRCRRAHLHTTQQRAQQSGDFQRYGPAAASHLPPPAKPSEPYLPSTEQTKQDETEREVKRADRQKRQQQSQSVSGKDSDGKQEEPVSAEEPSQDTSDAIAKEQEVISKSTEPQKPKEIVPDETPLGNKELDMVLSIPSPSEIKSTSDPHSHRHPHLETPPYEHHFDTYSLVQDLGANTSNNPNADPADHAFSAQQAVTLMKAIRLMLAQNLDLAKEGLVSKSDTENETYLFRAACSELKTTMQTARFMEAQKQRSQRAQLQHEFDILNQKVNQDVAALREELRGMFNDRKLRVQEDKRHVDGKISGLNYLISVDLNSEAKSEVEGLRWVLTRRAALAIGAAASMIVISLQYYSSSSRKKAELEKKRTAAREKEDEAMKRDQDRLSSSTLRQGTSSGTQTDGIVLGGTAGSGPYGDSLG